MNYTDINVTVSRAPEDEGGRERENVLLADLAKEIGLTLNEISNDFSELGLWEDFDTEKGKTHLHRVTKPAAAKFYRAWRSIIGS